VLPHEVSTGALRAPTVNSQVKLEAAAVAAPLRPKARQNRVPAGRSVVGAALEPVASNAATSMVQARSRQI